MRQQRYNQTLAIKKAHPHFVLLSYDIRDDRLRTKLFKLLKRYGTAVQFSVFECYLDAQQRRQLQVQLVTLLGDDRQNVLWYELCRECEQQVRDLGIKTAAAFELVYLL